MGNKGAAAGMSLLSGSHHQRHNTRSMLFLRLIMELLIEALHSLVADVAAERFSQWLGRFLPAQRLRGMPGVRRHIHEQSRRRLFRRLSTGDRHNPAE